jgi:four helix bundle protein
MRDDKQNIIVDKSIDFSLAIMTYCELLNEQKKYIIAKQLLRSATSIGANIFEAQNAESKADFIHKMKVAAKEASETSYWLLLCERSETYKFDSKLRIQLDEIIRILSKIISTSKTGIPSLILSVCVAFSNFQIFKLIN